MSVEMDVDSGDVVPLATELDAGPAPAEEDHAPETDVLMPESLPDAAPPDPIQPELSEPKPTPGPHYKIRYSLSGHTMSISSLKFSPDGSKLASSGADKIIKLWDTYTGDVLRTLVGHTEGISDIAWSNDGDYLASASDDKTIRIWDMKVGTEIKTLLGHTNFVFCVNYNPTSNLLVSGGFDETVRVWDVARAKSLKVLPAHSDPVTSVSFNHDGTLIVSCAMDGLIRIWDADSGQCLKTLVDDDNPICSHVKFTPNSKFVLASPKTHDSTTYSGHTNRTYCIFACFINTKGNYVVSGSEDAKVYIWDLQTRQVLQVLEGHRAIIASASMEKDLTIRVWYDNNEGPSTQ
ncbi:WD40-repeat-containing domain protein [Mycena leptocephala]|nr:WD40-repeat-containing domain protein [Mycena leptocephala]